MSRHLEGVGITVFDADSRGGAATCTLSATRGTISVSAGNSGVVITANNAASVAFGGSIAALDSLFRGDTTGTIIITSASTGLVTFSLTVLDEDGLSSTITFDGIIETLVAPAVITPVASLTADVGVAFQLCNIGFGVSDADDTNGYATLRLQIDHGAALTALPADTGVTVVSGNSTDDLVLTGTITSLNSFLSDITAASMYLVAIVSNSHTLTVTCTDSNQQSGVATKSITVAAAPNVVGPAAFLGSLTGNDVNLDGIGFSYSDTDATGSDAATCVIVTDTGRLTLAAGDSGVTIVTTGGFANPSGGDATPANTKVTGTKDQINNFLQSIGTGTIVFHKTTAGTSTVTVTVTDNTSRSGSATATVIMSATTTWTGYATATPTPTTATIANYVYSLDLSKLPLAWWAIVTADGRDIRITHDVLGTDTLLPYDLVHFSISAKTGTLFFKMDQSTSPDTVKVWAGATSSTAPVNATDVYDTSIIQGFWPDGGGNDRTVLANHLTGVNDPDVGAIDATFGKATAYDGFRYSHLSGAGVAAAIPECLVSYVNCDQRDSEAIVGSTRGIIENILMIRQQKVTCKTSFTSATTGNEQSDVKGSAVGDIPKGTWQQVAAIFYTTSARLVYRAGGNVGSDVNSKTGAGGTNRYFIGASVANASGGAGGIAVERFFHGSIGLTYILTTLSLPLMPIWIANANAALDQTAYWGDWAFVSQSKTGL